MCPYELAVTKVRTSTVLVKTNIPTVTFCMRSDMFLCLTCRTHGQTATSSIIFARVQPACYLCTVNPRQTG